MTRPNAAISTLLLRLMLAMAIAMSLASSAHAGWPRECDEKEPFKSARFAPPDITLLLEVRGAAGLRRTLADRPIATWLRDLVNSEELDQVWQGLADQTGVPRDVLFDSCLGSRFTLFTRSGGDGIGEWAIIAETHPFRLKRIFEKLNPIVIGPTAGMTLSELPEHQLLLARDRNRLVVAPKSGRGLFDEVVALAGREDDRIENTLAAGRELQRARSIGGGRVELFVRHGGLIGGWSAVAATVDGDDVALKHIARFENSPFGGDISERAVHPSLLEAFEEHSLMAVAMPADVGDGPLSSFVQARLGQPLLSQPLRRNRGDVQMLSVGEVEGRMEPDPVDLLVPTFAICMELLDPTTAQVDLDEHMMRIARQMQQKSNGSFLVPLDGAGVGMNPRHVDLAGAGDWLSGGFPILKNVSLNWTVASGPGGSSFAVIATHPEQLDAAVAALAAASRTGEPARRLAHAGTLDGVRLSQHLASYAAQADSLVGAAAADEFRQSLTMLAHLCAGMERARWAMTRPCGEEMRLDATIRLAPNPSSPANADQRGRNGDNDEECPRRPDQRCRDSS